MALALWAGPASSEDMAVFGLSLGARLSFAECEKALVGRSTLYPKANAVCFERLGSQDKVRDTAPIGTDSILIRYPEAEVPSFMSGAGVVGLVIDGSLEGIAFNTRGVDAQDLVLATLKEKFGEPTSLVPKQVQNSLGQTFEVYDAGWTLPQVEILFRSVTSRVDAGLLSVDSGKGRDYRLQRQAAPPTTGNPE